MKLIFKNSIKLFCIFNIAAIACGALLLAACEKKKESKTLTVGTSADNPPYEFIQDGKIVGLDIEVINAIAKELDKKVVVKNLDFHSLLPALISSKVDVVIAGLSVTPERAEKVDFSEQYAAAEVAVLYRKVDQIVKEENLNNKIIGAQLGTTWGQVAEDLAKTYDGKTQFLANNLMLVEQLKAKAVDVVIIEVAQAKAFIAHNDELAYFIVKDTNVAFSIALKKGSAITKDINKALQKLKADNTLDNLSKKWLE